MVYPLTRRPSYSRRLFLINDGKDVQQVEQPPPQQGSGRLMPTRFYLEREESVAPQKTTNNILLRGKADGRISSN